MFLHHLKSLGQANRITLEETTQAKRELWALRKEMENYDPDKMQQLSFHLCKRNLYRLELNRSQAREIYLDTRPCCPILIRIFKWFGSASSDLYEGVKVDYHRVRNDHDRLIDKNFRKLHETFQQKIAAVDEMSDPMELAHLFIYGCGGAYRRIKYKNDLERAYRRIVEFSEKESYSLRALREITRAALNLDLEEKEIRLIIGGVPFWMNQLLLKSLCGYFSGDNFETEFPDEDPTLFWLIYEYIEKGNLPKFDPLEEEAVYRYLDLCKKFMISKTLGPAAMDWLLENSRLFKFKVKPEGLHVKLKHLHSDKTIANLASVDNMFSIASLDITRINPITDKLMYLILEVCPNIRKLTLRPFVGVSENCWNDFLSRPSLRVLELDIASYFGLHSHLDPLLKAMEGKERLPEIRFKNYQWVPTEFLRDTAALFPSSLKRRHLIKLR